MRRAPLMVRLLAALSITLGMLGAAFLPAAGQPDDGRTITIIKSFEDAGAAFTEGVVCFEAQNVQTNVVEDGCAGPGDLDGGQVVVVIPDLPQGLYLVAETQVPAAYELNAIPQAADLITSQTAQVSIHNTLAFIPPEPGSITVYKEDQDGAPLPGACFTVNGIGPECVDGDGVVTFPNLDPGTYTVTETTVPTGYEGEGPKDVTVEAGTDSPVTFVNTWIGTPDPGWITVYKVDEYNEPLTDACFTVYQNDAAVTDELCVDEHGVVVFDDLEPGTYVVHETTVPDGYEGDDPQEATVVAGEGTAVTFVNTWIPVDETGSIRVVKEFEGRTPLDGDYACFTVYQDDAAVTDEQCVDASNETVFEGLPLGEYVVVETTVPFGFLGDDPQHATIEYDGQEVVVYFLNTAFPTGDVLVTKKFCDDGSGTSISVTIIDPFQAEGYEDDDYTHCEFGNAEFAVYPYGALDAEPIVFETGEDGAIYFDGFFPITGDQPHLIVETHTGASAEFHVEEDRLTIIEVINFKDVEPGVGTLVVNKYFCYGYGVHGTVIDYYDDYYYDEWDVDAHCVPGNAEFAIYPFSDLHAAPIVFETGDDGTATIEGVPVTSLATPPHLLVETFTGAEFEFDIFVAGETVVIEVFNFVDDKEPEKPAEEVPAEEVEVTHLPETGAGAMAFGQGNGGEAFFLASLSLMAALGAAYTARRRAA